MDFGHGQPGSYAVEVSGWDMDEAFFVEKTELIWNSDGAKEISLSHAVRTGSVIFVRLMQPLANSESYPVACQALNVVESGAAGRSAVQLAQLRPRAFFKDTVRGLNYSSIKVA
jgi:hypothetical protein